MLNRFRLKNHDDSFVFFDIILVPKTKHHKYHLIYSDILLLWKQILILIIKIESVWSFQNFKLFPQARRLKKSRRKLIRLDPGLINKLLDDYIFHNNLQAFWDVSLFWYCKGEALKFKIISSPHLLVFYKTSTNVFKIEIPKKPH